MAGQSLIMHVFLLILARYSTLAAPTDVVRSNGSAASYLPTSTTSQSTAASDAVSNGPAGPSLIEVRSGHDLAAAITDVNVTVALVMNDIALSESDWAPYGEAPTTLHRNFTLLGAFEEPERWPLVDFGFVRGKIRLRGPVIFKMSRIVITRTRGGALFQAPGFDLASSSPGNHPVLLANVTMNTLASRAALITLGTIRADDVTLVQRICLPASMFNKSMSGLPRPQQIPGVEQRVALLDQFPNCVNSTTAPYMRRCWSTISEYIDVASFAIDMDGPTYLPIPQDYLMHVTNFLYVCEQYMSEECVAEFSTTGCFLRMSSSGGGDHVSGGRGDSHSALIGAVVGAVGAVLIGAGLFGMLAIRRRRSRHLKGQQPSAAAAEFCKLGDIEGGKAPPSSTTTVSLAAGPMGSMGASHSTETNNGSAYVGKQPPELVKRQTVGYAAGDTSEEKQLVEARSLVPVTPLTPLDPGVNLRLKMGAEVQLTSMRLGAGTFGAVFRGFYFGEPVAVKMVKVGLRPAAAAGNVAIKCVEDHLQQQQQPQQQEQKEAKQATSGGPDSTTLGAEAILPGLPADCAKRYAPSTTVGSSTLERRSSLLQEVEVLGRCQHPNIVRLLAANVEPPSICLVMELMDTSLDQVLHGNHNALMSGLLPLPKVLHIAIQIARALAYLHPTILHRDLKPGNVLIKDPHSDSPVAKLADFGLARLLDTVLLTRHPEVGTAPYMAPEVFDLENTMVTDRADIYSLGVILYELLAARRPWPHLGMVQIAYNVTVNKARLPLEEVPSSRCPAKLRTLIHACWEADPSRRPAAAEVVKMLLLVKQEVSQSSARPRD